MPMSPQAPLKDRIADHRARCMARLSSSQFRNRDIKVKLRLTRVLHEEVLVKFFDTKGDIDQDLGYYHRLLVQLDELMLDLLSRASVFPDTSRP